MEGYTGIGCVQARDLTWGSERVVLDPLSDAVVVSEGDRAFYMLNSGTGLMERGNKEIMRPSV